MLYLIAHKVRGERAFDVATKLDDWPLKEEVWIIPTSGHRAYPYWHMPLDELLVDGIDHVVGDLPLDLRDHYTVLNPPALAKRERSGFAAPTAEDL